MPDILDQMGLTAEVVIEKHLVPLLNAKEVKFLQNDTAYTILENTNAQLRALHMSFLLGGYYAPKGQLVKEEATVRTILVGQMDPP